MYNLKQLYKLKEKIRTLEDEKNRVERDLRKITVGYIIAAFGFVAGLAWRDLSMALVEYLFPMSKDTILAKFIYAIVISITLAFISIYVLRFIGKTNKKKGIENIQ
ncbi:MAG: DUF5654 family protein [Bacteroidales bacterium]|nr:DUF5654 family protein [Bacteroidales bacterium]